MSTLEIVGVAYIALDIILGIIIYAIIRCKGWRKRDIAINFRNLLRMKNYSFKQTIAEQIGYADYNETYRNGYDNGYNNGYNNGYDARVEEEEEERKEEERRKAESARRNAINSILGIFSILGF